MITCVQRMSTDMTATSWNPKELTASLSLDSASTPSPTTNNPYVRRLSLIQQQPGRGPRGSLLPGELLRQKSSEPDRPGSVPHLQVIGEED